MTVSQMLQEGRALIEAGWCQGMESREPLGDGNKEYCIMGAMHTSTGPCAAWQAAMEALTRHLPRDKESLMRFNDDPKTTKRRVLALFDRALTEVTK